MTKDERKQKPAKPRRPARRTTPSTRYPNPEDCTCVGHVGIHSTVGCLHSDCGCTRGAL